jgi:hypothetical protein
MLYKFRQPAPDEIDDRFVVLEDRGDRVLVQYASHAYPIKPTDVYLKTDIEPIIYTMNPCVKSGEYYWACSENNPNIHCWAIYKINDHDLHDWISDHDTKAAALNALKKLQEA